MTDQIDVMEYRELQGQTMGNATTDPTLDPSIAFIFKAGSNPGNWTADATNTFLTTLFDSMSGLARHNNETLISALTTLKPEILSLTRETVADSVLAKVDVYRVHNLIDRRGENRQTTWATDVVKLMRILVENKAAEKSAFYSIFKDPHKKAEQAVKASLPSSQSDEFVRNVVDEIAARNKTMLYEALRAYKAEMAIEIRKLREEVISLKGQQVVASTSSSSQAALQVQPQLDTASLSSSATWAQRLLNNVQTPRKSAATSSLHSTTAQSKSTVNKRQRPTGDSPPASQPTPKKHIATQRQRELLSFDSYNPSAPNRAVNDDVGFKVAGPRRKRNQATVYISRLGTGAKTYPSIARRKQTVFLGRFNPGTTLEDGTAILNEVVTRDNNKLQFENLRLLTLPSKKIAFLFEIDYSCRDVVRHHDIWPNGIVVDFSIDPTIMARRKSNPAPPGSKTISSPKEKTSITSSTVNQYNIAD